MANSTDSATHKRPRQWADAKQRLQHGSRSAGRKGKDLGRKEWSRQQHNRRAENDERNAKRQKVGADDANVSGLAPAFSQDEISAESRRPKHKVAVMIGYSGTGYKGMQINTTERTIEGELFSAFVAAGAISKANADDPKKSALVRCARTDKGVHAAGNVISLKLIVEEPDIVSKINSHLCSQIRVWGIQRTVNSFSSYQACDSRWYEYLIPSHAFLPPHPGSYLGKRTLEMAEQSGDAEEHRKRQAEVADFWVEVEQQKIQPIIETLDESVRELVVRALYDSESDDGPSSAGAPDVGDAHSSEVLETASGLETTVLPQDRSAGEAPTPENLQHSNIPSPTVKVDHLAPTTLESSEQQEDGKVPHTTSGQSSSDSSRRENDRTANTDPDPATASNPDGRLLSRKQATDAAVKSLREAYMLAKRSYRILPDRLERIASALEPFIGTRNFHNYTIGKTFRDPSAKRHIRSFTLNREPVVINGTEWLSIKIHGQSFMMHQIRKMVSMVALTVRCGCPISRISETLGPDIVSIPKAPGVGLLLERPVFDSYNDGVATKYSREKIDFARYEAELKDFKQKEIYERIFREEEQTAAFQIFFNQIDSFKEPQFLYLTSKGLDAIKDLAKTRMSGAKPSKLVEDFESDEETQSEDAGGT